MWHVGLILHNICVWRLIFPSGLHRKLSLCCPKDNAQYSNCNSFTRQTLHIMRNKRHATKIWLEKLLGGGGQLQVREREVFHHWRFPVLVSIEYRTAAPCTLNRPSVIGHEKSGNNATYCRRGSGVLGEQLYSPQHRIIFTTHERFTHSDSPALLVVPISCECSVASLRAFVISCAVHTLTLIIYGCISCAVHTFTLTLIYSCDLRSLSPTPPLSTTHCTTAEKLILLSKQQTVTLWLQILNKLCLIANTSCGRKHHQYFR